MHERTIVDYLDAARARHNLSSDRQLGPLIGVNPAMPCQYRTGRAWPAHDVMIKLAGLAGVDADTALVELQLWKYQDDPATIAAWARIARKIAAGLLIAGLCWSASPLPAAAGTEPAQLTFGACSMYIMSNWFRRRAGRFSFCRQQFSALLSAWRLARTSREPAATRSPFAGMPA